MTTETTGCIVCGFGFWARHQNCPETCDNHQTEIQIIARHNAEQAKQALARYEAVQSEDEWVEDRLTWARQQGWVNS